MEVFLIVYKHEDSYSLSSNKGAVAISSEEKAIKCAGAIASEGVLKTNEENSIRNVSLEKIIKFDTEALRGNECELILENGRFSLYNIKPNRKKATE